MSYTLYHGDCLEVMPTLPDRSVDAVICDPPYGTTACKWDSVIPFDAMWAELKRLIRPRGAIVLFGSQPFTSALVMSNPKWFRHEWIWQKNRGSNFANTVREPMKEHESIICFSEGRWTYNPQMQGRASNGLARVQSVINPSSASNNYGDLGNKKPTIYPDLRLPSSVQKFNTEVGLHPTQKPLALMEYLVKTYTDAGDTVLDFTMGSGTTGHACMNTGRRFIGIEKDAAYFAIAQERIAAAHEPLRHMEAVA